MGYQVAVEEEFEAISPLGKAIKALFVNPWINHFIPRRPLKKFLMNSKCRLLHASFEDPGGWKSMCVAYDHGEPLDFIDKVVCELGAFPMSLRNRKRLASRIMADLFDSYPPRTRIHVVEAGAGCGHNVQEAMRRARHKNVHAYCIDLAADAFEYGRRMARSHGHTERVNFIVGNVLEIEALIDVRPDIVTAIGILEYLTDKQILDILRALHASMPKGAAIIGNSTYNGHGTDRFLRTILNLHIIYRTTEEVTLLMAEAGFSDFTAEREPLGVYEIIVGRKR